MECPLQIDLTAFRIGNITTLISECEKKWERGEGGRDRDGGRERAREREREREKARERERKREKERDKGTWGKT